MRISTSQAAERLGISGRRLHALLAEGRIPAQRVGGQWVIDAADLAPYRAAARSAGRPLSRRSVWQLIRHGSGVASEAADVPSLSPIERYRLSQRLERLARSPEPLTLLVTMLATRADKVELSAAVADLAGLRLDPRIRLSGLSHPAAGLLANAGVEAYVDGSHVAALTKDWFLTGVTAGHRPNVLLHVMDDVPQELGNVLDPSAALQLQPPNSTAVGRHA